MMRKKTPLKQSGPSFMITIQQTTKIRGGNKNSIKTLVVLFQLKRMCQGLSEKSLRMRPALRICPCDAETPPQKDLSVDLTLGKVTFL